MSTQVVEPVIVPTDAEALLALVVDKKKIEEMKSSSSPFLVQARAFSIESQGDYEFSLTIAEDAIRRRQAKQAWFAPLKKLSDMLHSMICAMEKQAMADDVEVEQIIKGRRIDWRQAEERKRLQAENEARRIAKDEADKKALADAAALEAEGQPEAAQEVLQQAIAAPAPAVVVQSSVPKQTGSAVRKKFSYRIDDPEKVQREFCSPDPKKIKAHVDAYGMASKISGVTPYPDETEAIRTKGR